MPPSTSVNEPSRRSPSAKCTSYCSLLKSRRIVRPTSTRGKRPKDTRKLALSPLSPLFSLVSRLPRCLSSSTSTGLHHVESKRRDLVIITSWRMGSDAMITAVASLLEAPDAPFSCSGSIFFIYPSGTTSCASYFCDLATRTSRRALKRITRLTRNVSRVIHDTCVYEDNRTRKFFPRVQQVITW